MGKYKKREILKAATSLFETNSFIVKNYKVNNAEDIVKTLAQCQDVAVELGNYLETLESIGEVFVPILESYCENLYKLACNLENENIFVEISKHINRQLLDLKNGIWKKIPNDRIEMVFFPYKVSMWDSLESIWQAAVEDPDCDAYVVPIPYFEKNTAGEFTTEHYEGNQFPENVPIVNYKNYNIAVHRPDVAFIHNPYDQYNYVTSIHPAYYISELKKYIDKVAYIPYYVSAEINPEAPEVQKQKEGFILTPGVLYSDFVFVQSESMKQLYVNVLKKNVSGVEEKYWENKIFGLGSPKMDRVHSVKRDDSRLPLKWKSLIFDETGKRKKVILYNISVADLLNHKNMMEKIADTLAFFEKNRDCVLWWRPHPLYESTIRTMRPDLLKAYHQIVEQYKAGGWGIFDEGEDLNWAIAETDAYYGDGSSVVQLYLEAGKPVLYQDTRVRNGIETDMHIPVWARTFCVAGDEVWFMHGKMNLLIKYHLSTRTGEIIGSVPGEFFFQPSLYGAMHKEGDKIYLIPCWGKEIAIYDISNGEFSKIKLRGIEKYENKALFCKCFAIENGLYCIPESYEAIIKIDLDTQEIIYFDLRCYMTKDVQVCLEDAVLINGKIICPWNHSNQLLAFELKDEHIFWMKFGKDRKYTRLGKLEDKLVLYDEVAQQIVIIVLETGQEQIMNLQCGIPSFSEIPGPMLMIDTIYTDEIFCADKKGKLKYKKTHVEEKRRQVLQYDYKCGFTVGDAEVCWYFDTKSGILYRFDNDGIKNRYDIGDIRIYKEQIEKIMKDLLRRRENENEVLSLKKWIEQGIDFDINIEISNNNGKKIKECVKKFVF